MRHVEIIKKTVLLLWSFVTLFVGFFLVFSQTLVLRPLYFLKKYTFLFGLWFLVKTYYNCYIA